MSTIKKRTRKPTRVFAFIDTNIFLDFYRAKSEANISLLRKLEQVKDRIICSYQVEMEFLKNRQNQILQISRDVDLNVSLQLPAVLSESQVNKTIRKSNSDLKRQKGILDKRVASLLSDPGSHDPVYRTLESIFTNKSSHVLTRDMVVRHKIKRLAWRRFMLGYPPRKDKDTSIGDSLNWEWIIHCGNQLSGKFIIVSRDSDFGAIHKKKAYLNDALKQEFRDRVGKKSISFTNKLTDALKALEVHVTEAEEESESESIAASKSSSDFTSRVVASMSQVDMEDMLNRIKIYQELMQNRRESSSGD